MSGVLFIGESEKKTIQEAIMKARRRPAFAGCGKDKIEIDPNTTMG